MVQVDRVDQAPPHHHRPKPIDDVPAELGDRRRKSDSRQARRGGCDEESCGPFCLFPGRPDIRLPWAAIGSGRARPVQDLRAGLVRHFLLENRGERHVSFGFLGEDGDFLSSSNKVVPVQEREDTVIMSLFVIVDQRVVVALGALQVAAEEHPADVSRQQVGIGQAVEIKLRGPARRGDRSPSAARISVTS